MVDADNGLGHPAAKLAMQKVIEKAQAPCHHRVIPGDAVVIRIANHAQSTNPFAFAIPTELEPPFVLDFATTTVPRGRLEVYERKNQQLEEGWAIDARGETTRDPGQAMRGALLPLGGYGTEHGGHKGYGLGLLADILCGVLAGGKFGRDLADFTQPGHGGISHWFGAFRVDGFREVAEFKADMDRELRYFKESPKAPGHERIYVAGESEHENTLRHRAGGVPVHVKVWEDLRNLAGELGVPFELARR